MNPMRMLLLGCFAIFNSLIGPASAGPLSNTGPVIAILDGGLFQGEAQGRLDGSGTVTIQSSARTDLSCVGQFTSSAALGGTGTMRCSDGGAVDFQFKRLGLTRGHGTGTSSRGTLSFTYGLTAVESERYLALPPGKALRINRKDLLMIDAE